MMDDDASKHHEQAMADREMVRRILGGDQSAVEAFFDRHVHGLYRFVGARLRDPEATREVVQSTFAEALASLASYRGDGPLTAWLYSVCRFRLSAHTRGRRRGASHLELLEDAPEILALVDDLPGALERPDSALRRKEITAHVHVTLDQLPPRYAAALEWKYLDELPVKEIAARLTISAKAAESLLSRARGAFRRAFAGGAAATDDPTWSRR